MNPPDPRDTEIAVLRQQVTNLSEALARVSQLAAAPPQPSGPDPERGYQPPGFVTLPSGQCVRVPLASQDAEFIRQEGFRWEGDTPVFPPHWPKVAPEADEKATLI